MCEYLTNCHNVRQLRNVVHLLLAGGWAKDFLMDHGNRFWLRPRLNLSRNLQDVFSDIQ